MIAGQPSQVSTHGVYAAPAPITAQSFGLGLVWLTICSSSVVFAEPAPYDALMFGLFALLPLLRLTSLSTGVFWFLVAWLVVAAGGLVASMRSVNLDVSIKHTLITIYLSLSAVLIAAFVRKDPQRHIRLIMSGLACAAFIAVLAGALGYFDVLPGTRDLFTKFDRARGLFKDPNVYGPFIVPALIYYLHRTVTSPPLRAIWNLAFVAFFSLGLLISFSRGAWFNASVALLVYIYVLFIASQTHRQRMKLILIGTFGMCTAALTLIAAMQIESIASLIGERASLSLSYDSGPDGRFAGQLKAFNLVAANPFGIGALEFGRTYDNEDVHNTFLSMFLNAGWVGGFAYLGLVLTTLAMGFRQALRKGPLQGISIVMLSAFAGLAIEGMVVDTDHWRHFFILMGAIWGLILANKRNQPQEMRPT